MSDTARERPGELLEESGNSAAYGPAYVADSPGHPEPSPPGARQWAALSVLLLGAFMGFLDIFIVNVANPFIQADLGASFAQIQLVPAGYTLAYAVGLVTGGRLGDIFGQRRVFLLGVVAFAFTSALCAAARTPEFLIGARVLQGLAAAVMLPQVLALVRVTFARESDRARAVGLYGAVIGLGVVAGTIVGGLLLEWDVAGLGWRAIFLVNVPLCLAAFVGARLLVPGAGEPTRVRLDPVGVVLLSLGLSGVLHPLVIGGESGWSPLMVAELAVALLVLALFVVWERRVSVRGGAPLLPPRLFRRRGFAVGMPAALFFYGVNGAFVFVLAFHLQRALGFSPFAAALEFTPMAVVTSVGAMLCGRLVARLGSWVVPAGAAVMTGGLLAVWGAVELAGVGELAGTVSDSQAAALWLLPGLLLYGFGGGIVATSLIGMALADAPPEDAGAASGGILTVVQASEAAGVAGVGALFTAAVSSSGLLPGFAVTVLVLTVLSVLTTVLLLFLRRPTGSR